MCAICDDAKSKPTHIGLSIISTAMQNPKNKDLACLDKTIGDIIGIGDAEQDKEKDAAWAKGTTWDKLRN
jgi:hypothetical protein